MSQQNRPHGLDQPPRHHPQGQQAQSAQLPDQRSSRAQQQPAHQPGQQQLTRQPARQNHPSNQRAAQAAQQAARTAQQAAQEAQAPQAREQPRQHQPAQQPAQAHQRPVRQQRQPQRVQQPTAAQQQQPQQTVQQSQAGPAPQQQPQVQTGLRQAQQPPAQFTPAVDVIDNPDEITVIADLPGCDGEDINVQATDYQLSIAAERLEAEDTEEGSPLQRERGRTADRTIQLPASVNVDEAEATCEHGVCQVVLPKDENDRRQEIGFQ